MVEFCRSIHILYKPFGDYSSDTPVMFFLFYPTVPHHCPHLELISVGRVMPYHEDEGYTQPVIGDVATYSCVEGYRVVGDITRTCVLTVNGTAKWNGTEPHCESMHICKTRRRLYVCTYVHMYINTVPYMGEYLVGENFGEPYR